MEFPTRERRLIETFVALSDTLVDDYDVVDLTQVLVDQSVAILGAASAGVVLADASGRVEVLASSDEDAELVDLLQLREGRGPCMEAYRTGVAVVVPDIGGVDGDWESFRSTALALGLCAAHAFPMRLRGRVIGSLTLFLSAPGALSDDDAAVAQAFADVATIGILHQRAQVESDVVQSQLQRALDSRVVVEQAKGFLAYSRDIAVDDAFELLRGQARRTSTAITKVARAVLDGELDLRA